MFEVEDIENYRAEMRADSSIYREGVIVYAVELPIIHAKWIERLANYRFESVRLESNYKRALNRTRIYYMGKASPDVYKEKPFPAEYRGTKLTKGEIDIIVDADEDVIGARESYEIAQIIVDEITSFMYQLGKNTQLLKTIHDAERMDAMIGA